MPEISNLYAEIGFKVNESGLQEFTERLTSLKKEIDKVAESLKGIESLKINIPEPKVVEKIQKLSNKNLIKEVSVVKDDSFKKETKKQQNRDIREKERLQKLDNQTKRTENSIKRENRLRDIFEYKKQQDAEKKEEKREKEKQRETKRHEKFMGGIFRGLGSTMLSVGGTIAALTKFGFSQAEEAAIRSNVYKNYEVLTGDKSFDLQELSSLAVATGGASGATALNELSGQLLNLKRNWSQLVRDEWNAKELKLLGLRGHQSPAEMAKSILNVIKDAKVDPGIIAESLTNLGLNASLV